VNQFPVSLTPDFSKGRVMPKYLLVYHNAPYDMSSIAPEQMQEAMKLWNSWIGEGMQRGWMVDGGDGLLPDGRVIDSNKVVTDGPLAETKEIVGGYSIVQADTYEQAVQCAMGCPILAEGGRVEVRQLAGLG